MKKTFWCVMTGFYDSGTVKAAIGVAVTEAVA
jgi:hypothetical protein